jgi:hypothetical protein
MDFYDVREATTIFSSHKTLYQACLGCTCSLGRGFPSSIRKDDDQK